MAIDFSNRPPGQSENANIGDAGVTTGVEDTYGVNNSALNNGFADQKSISGECGSDEKGKFA